MFFSYLQLNIKNAIAFIREILKKIKCNESRGDFIPI